VIGAALVSSDHAFDLLDEVWPEFSNPEALVADEESRPGRCAWRLFSPGRSTAGQGSRLAEPAPHRRLQLGTPEPRKGPPARQPDAGRLTRRLTGATCRDLSGLAIARRGPVAALRPSESPQKPLNKRGGVAECDITGSVFRACLGQIIALLIPSRARHERSQTSASPLDQDTTHERLHG
jgi:hypothetical protein